MWTQLGVLAHILVAAAVALRVLTRPRMEPSVRLAWVLVAEALPVIGALAYLFFGEIRLNAASLRRRMDIRAELTGIWTPSPETVTDPPPFARATLAAWRTVYNTERPHSRLGWQTPAEFAQTFTPQRGPTLRDPQSSAPAPVAQPAENGKTQARSLVQTG